MGRLFTMNEAAEALRISRRTLDRYVSDGLLPKIKFGGRALIEQKELEKFLKRGKAS